ncbi:hypothetical protein T07_1773 [Trichinella nelsoni]|uniref:Uncharacterized protein n=1 Tax=Trichinella nelsoni TaxID=6336 RepID=A0A0V0RCI1_9BILA|nr:hypothetical protein T07_1773 [Trichinella nelsoni]
MNLLFRVAILFIFELSMKMEKKHAIHLSFQLTSSN